MRAAARTHGEAKPKCPAGIQHRNLRGCREKKGFEIAVVLYLHAAVSDTEYGLGLMAIRFAHFVQVS